MWPFLIALTSVVTGTPAMHSAGREFYVAPTGRPTNDGSEGQPLDLATALSRVSPAKPGDTIWLRGGVYHGTFISDLNGTATAPIVVRQYPGERATIDSNPTQLEALLARGSYTWFWGFEITNSDPDRYSSQTGSWPSDLKRGYGVTARGVGLKFINLIVHDMLNGFGIWTDAVDAEAYGNLVYYNGWQAPDRAHGHGLYTQNQTGLQRLVDNIVFMQFSHGLHSYGSDAAFLNNITHEGNIAFDNGIISQDGLARELLLGGGSVAQNPVVKDNVTYGAQVAIGYSGGCTNGVVTGNYFAGTGVFLTNCAATVTGNTMYSIYGLSSLPTGYPQNTFLATAPSGVVVRVRPNQYEPGRAHIAIYNWNDQPQVTVDLSAAGLTIGQRFDIRDAQNYFGAPVASRVYDGAPVTLPMAGLSVAAPIGNVPVAPRHTGPRFAAFVVVPDVSATPPPPPPPNSPPTVTLTTPAPGTSFTAPATITLTASASDPDGSVASVAFYQNGALLGTDTTAPYLWSWTGVAAGSYTLTAIVTDAQGATATSAPATITVTGSDSNPDVNPPPPTTTARFLGVDTITQGNWQSIYGRDGYALPSVFPRWPSYATGSFANALGYVWQPLTSDQRALYYEALNGILFRRAATWTNNGFTITIALSGTTARRMAAYFLDWDAGDRVETVELLDDATGDVLDTRIVSEFSGGQYLVWEVAGTVRLRVAATSGANAVLSGLFFDPPR